MQKFCRRRRRWRGLTVVAVAVAVAVAVVVVSGVPVRKNPSMASSMAWGRPSSPSSSPLASALSSCPCPCPCPCRHHCCRRWRGGDRRPRRRRPRTRPRPCHRSCFDLALPDPPLGCALHFFLFRVATSHTFAGSGSPEVRRGSGGLALPDTLRRMLRFFLFAWLRPMRSRALALRRLMMVASASIAGCCRTQVSDGWSGDGMLCGCGRSDGMVCVVGNRSPYTKSATNLHKVQPISHTKCVN